LLNPLLGLGGLTIAKNKHDCQQGTTAEGDAKHLVLTATLHEDNSRFAKDLIDKDTARKMTDNKTKEDCLKHNVRTTGCIQC